MPKEWKKPNALPISMKEDWKNALIYTVVSMKVVCKTPGNIGGTTYVRGSKDSCIRNLLDVYDKVSTGLDK